MARVQLGLCTGQLLLLPLQEIEHFGHIIREFKAAGAE